MGLLGLHWPSTPRQTPPQALADVQGSPSKLAGLSSPDGGDDTTDDVFISPRGSISSSNGQSITPSTPSAVAGIDLAIPATQPADSAALDALVTAMLDAQGEKAAVRLRVLALPVVHKWALLTNYRALQQSGSGGQGGGGGLSGRSGFSGSGAEEDPEGWIRSLELQPELESLQQLGVLLRTLPLACVPPTRYAPCRTGASI